jgi:hypothetical protein
MELTTGTIFINYRKDDSSWNALALYNELQKYFAKEQIFKDFNTILPGDDFTISIQNALAKCDVLLVVMGKSWLNMKDVKGNRRLDDPDDFVRIEIATALERNIQVIPVLFDDIPMPSVDELPANMKTLVRRQFVEIETKRFEDDVRNLADAIRKVLSAIYPSGNYKHVDPNQHKQPLSTNTGNGYGNKAPTGQTSTRVTSTGTGNGNKPDNNLVMAIIVTVLCCLPLGIVAIINASKVDSLWTEGKHEEARAMAAKAKQWSIYAVIVGVIVLALYFFLYMAGMAGGDMSY